VVSALQGYKEVIMAKITTIPIFKNKSLSAGDSGTSDVIDLRYCASNYTFCLSNTIAAGTATTCGTTIFSYVGCPTVDGTFASPVSTGTFGTSGPAAVGKLTNFSPVLTPFMKIIATQTGAGTAGANSKVTAALIVQ
jgi:hypothetical protein